jgi:hypothetical protein
MKATFTVSIAISVLWFLFPGCVLPSNAFKSGPTVKGFISGVILNSKGRSISGVGVEGIWLQRWTIGYLPPGFEMIDGQTTSDENGGFALYAPHKLDILYAQTADGRFNGQLTPVIQKGNIILLMSFNIDRMNVH